MFCVQCEQTIRTQPATAALTRRGCAVKQRKPRTCRILPIASLQGLSAWALKAREYGIIDYEVDSFAPAPSSPP